METKSATGAIGGTLLVFCAYYLGLSAMTFGFFAITQLEANSGVGVAVVMASAMAASQSHGKSFGDLPRGGVLWKLVFASLIASLVLSFGMFAAWLAFNGLGIGDFLATLGLDSLSVEMIAISLAVVTLLHVLVLWISYGPLARFITKRQQKKK